MHAQTPLEPPDIHYLRATEGWLGLGDWVSARDELEQITPAARAHPAVLMVRCDVFHAARNWNACLAAAETLLKTAPEKINSWLECSVALQRVGRVQDAYALLLPAVERFPESWDITYNLACFSSQLGHLVEAWWWLEKSIQRHDAKAVIRAALGDYDLELLWPQIARIAADLQTDVGSSTHRTGKVCKRSANLALQQRCS